MATGIKCPVCTYINESGTLSCEMCEINYNDGVNENTNIVIDENIEQAFVVIPELFSTVNLIYIMGIINGVHVKMFVDSGAQKSIIPESLVSMCNLNHLVDNKCEGEVAGIGSTTQIMLGRIHMVGIMLPLIGGESTVEISCGFTVLSRSIEEHNIGIIFGLDIMVSYGVSLNFSERTMIINGYTVPFMKVDEVSQIEN